MSKHQPKLRFCALIRVSTEKQAAKGESLKTQRTQIEQAVESLGGKLTKVYSGQEHGTQGYERKQLDKMLADAEKKRKPFDAVMVADASRWSRDNVRSETGLEILKNEGVRFYSLMTEHDLFKPEVRMSLAMFAVMGQYQANTQKQKSLLNRIERAKRGIPTGGKYPYGRIWHKSEQKWDVDTDKKQLIVEVAKRYLSGESLVDLAKEASMNHSNLTKILRERCGSDWQLRFAAKDLNIDETVVLTVPRLLPPKTIKQIQQRLTANRTYRRKGGQQVATYLLSGRIFCMECGYAMFGQLNHGKRRYYRHAHTERVRQCPLKRQRWVRADKIEKAVDKALFDMMGNPAAIKRAIKRAIPDCDKLTTEKAKVQSEIKKIRASRSRILNQIDRDTITENQAEEKLLALKERETKQQDRLEILDDRLANVPDQENAPDLYTIKLKDGSEVVMDYNTNEPYAGGGGNDLIGALTRVQGDVEAMVATAFDQCGSDGKPGGVYIRPRAKGGFEYEIRGIMGDGVSRALH